MLLSLVITATTNSGGRRSLQVNVEDTQLSNGPAYSCHNNQTSHQTYLATCTAQGMLIKIRNDRGNNVHGFVSLVALVLLCLAAQTCSPTWPHNPISHYQQSAQWVLSANLELAHSLAGQKYTKISPDPSYQPVHHPANQRGVFSSLLINVSLVGKLAASW